MKLQQKTIPLPPEARRRDKVAIRLKEKPCGDIGYWELHSTKGWRKRGDYLPERDIITRRIVRAAG